jgi:coenzyme F420-dependent glucose-6-phosphate dehydrogenase
MIEIKISYEPDIEKARRACHWWAALALSPEEKSGIEDPIEMERLADANAERGETRFIVTDDPDQAAARIRPYLDLGFSHLVFHPPGGDQKHALELLSSDVLPRLRTSEAAGRGSADADKRAPTAAAD